MGTINNFQEEIYETIDILVNKRVKELDFDKTEKGEVVSVDEGTLEVRINGEIFTCKTKSGDVFEVGDVIYVKIPKNRTHDMYAESGSVKRYVHIKYSQDGGATFTGSEGEDEGSWMGFYVGGQVEAPNNPSEYKWNRIKGVDGQTQRVWIRYSNKPNGGLEDGSEMGTDPEGQQYIGTATTLVNKAPENPNSYTWSKVQGDQGIKGDNGYLHIKYSNDGGLTFTKNADGVPNGESIGDWIGIYTDNTERDSGDPADYTWNKVVGESERVWIRYSKYPTGGAPDGTEMSTNPRNMGYVGFAYNFNETAPKTPSGYDWVKVTGDDGVPGHNGYIHIKYSNDGGETFTENDVGYADGETAGDWIGIYTDNTEEDSMVTTDYTWNRITGESTRIWIRYSNIENGGFESGRDMSTDPKGKAYIGIADTQGDVAPTNPSAYRWSQIQGTDGIPGDNGYIHIKYSNDGGKTFTQPGNGERVGDWIGIYTDEKEEDSSNPARYKWNKIVGESERIWIQYSNKPNGGASDGSEMTANPVGRTYVGIAHTMDKEQPTDPSLYSWSQILGKDGVAGDSGYIHIKYSNNAGETFTENTDGIQDGETPGTWIGIYTDNIKGDSPYPTDYTWNKVVGDDGLSHGLYIRYSMYPDGGEDEQGFDMTTNPDGMDYIGIGTSTNGVPPRNPNSYTWSRIRGMDGVPGESGYVHIKYSDDGSTFTANDGEDFGKWIGIYTDNTEEDSMIFSDYKWNKIIGEPGKGIASMVEFYLISSDSSGVTVDSTGWTTTIQRVTQAQPYLWNYEQITYTDGDIYTKTPVIIGIYSEDGVGVSSITNYYLASPLSKGVTRSTTGWTTAMQNMDSKGKRYLWNYEVVRYTNGSSVPTEPVVIGIAGTDGYNGKDAVVGVLTNDNYVVPANEAGWVEDYTDINTEMQIFYGTFDDTVNWTFRVPYQENMQGTLVGNKYQVEYVSSMGGGYAEIEAKRPGFPTIRKKFTVATSRKGADSTTYWVDLNTTVLKEGAGGNYSPGTIVATAMRQKGAGLPESFKAMFLIMDKAPDDFSATVRYRTDFGADEYSTTFTPRRGLEYVTVGLYKDDYTNRLDMETVPVIKDGEDGTIITNVEEFYLASPDSTGVTTSTQGWQPTVPVIDEVNRYLWNYERMTYSKGDPHITQPAVIGTFSKDGVSISSIAEYYLVSEYKTGVTRSTTGWSTDIPDPDSKFKFLWNYSVTTYTNGTSEPTDPVVIGVYGKDGEQGVPGEPGEPGAPGEDGTSMYVWIRYSNSPTGGAGTGADMYESAGNRKYIGILNTDVYSTAPTNPSLYEWSKYRGEDGEPGAPGRPGDPGQPAHIHIKYSNLPQGGFSDETMFDDPAGMEFIGIMDSNSAIPSTEPSDYKWSKIQGDQGIPGESSYTHIRYSDNGTDFTSNGGRTLGKWIGIYTSKTETSSTVFSDYGWTKIVGEDGKDGESSFIWIKYSLYADGNPMSDDPFGAKYIGIAKTRFDIEPQNHTDFNWTLIKGSQGVKGDDGDSNYVHVKYSNDGGVSFTKQPGLEDGEAIGDWIGIYVSEWKIDSKDVNDYQWRKLRGEDGQPGTSILDVEVLYALSTSPTELTNENWSITPPEWSQGTYVWSKTKTTYSQGDPTFSRPVSITGYHGEDGESGRGVVGITQQYAITTSGTVAPTSGWVDNTPPTWEENKYIWTRSKIDYDKPPSPTYTTAIQSDVENRLGITELNVDQNRQEITSKVSLGDVQTSFALGVGWAKLSADRIDIEGAVTFSSLSTGVKSDLNKGVSAQGTVNGLLTPGKTTIDGGKITANSIKTDSLITTTLSAIEAQLGNVIGGTITGGEFISSSNTSRPGTDVIFGDYSLTSSMSLKEDRLRLDGNRYYNSYGRYRTGGATLGGDGLRITQNTPINTYGYFETMITDKGITMDAYDAESGMALSQGNIRLGDAADPVLGSNGGVIIDSWGGLLVNGNMQLGGQPFTGDNQPTGNLNMTGDLRVGEGYYFGGNINAKNITLTNDVNANNLSLTNDFYMRWDAEIGRYLKVGGTATFSDTAVFNGATAFNSTVTLNGIINTHARMNINFQTYSYSSFFSHGSLINYGDVYMGGSYVKGHIAEVGGNNTNWYIRFTNGTQITYDEITQAITGSSSSLPSNISGNYYYAASFASTPMVIGALEVGEAINMANRQVFTNRANFRTYHVSTVSTTANAKMLAIGRWKTITSSY